MTGELRVECDHESTRSRQTFRWMSLGLNFRIATYLCIPVSGRAISVAF
jgi:hypothetical protein